MLKVFFIEDQDDLVDEIWSFLTKKFQAAVTRITSLEMGIKIAEMGLPPTDLIICDYHGDNKALLSKLMGLIKGLPCIFIVDDPASNPEAKLTVRRQSLLRDLATRIMELEKSGAMKLDSATRGTVAVHETRLDKLLSSSMPDVATARVATEDALKVVYDITNRIGFAPEVQAIANKSVGLTVKVIGEKPVLSEIVKALKKNEGKFIASHSMMLAEISCGIASNLGMASPEVFNKLTFAAFLHDIMVPTNELAKCRNLEEAAKVKGVSSGELTGFKTHPTKAADYAKSFREIPSDVDTIIIQHHERPAGTGFPRGLHQGQIELLSAIFIVAEDLLHFYIDNNFRSSVLYFIKEREAVYSTGNFLKIMEALKAKTGA